MSNCNCNGNDILENSNQVKQFKCIEKKCQSKTCDGCYMDHIESKHPEMYSAPCLQCKEDTLYSQFVSYGLCSSCTEDNTGKK